MQQGSNGFLGTFICCLFGIVNDSAQDPPTSQVNGILGRSILLPVHLTLAKSVAGITWYFYSKTDKEPNMIAKFVEGELTRLNASDRFGQRLEMANGTMLRIKDLEMDDSGVYMADVRFVTSEIQSHSISLTVYEPVPQLKISLQNVSNTPEGCNVTLQCNVSGKGEFNVSWKRGDPPRALEEGSDCYQLSDNGTKLHLFGQFNASDANITCLVSNPADQKNVSFSLLKHCPDKGKSTLWFIRCITMDFPYCSVPCDHSGCFVFILCIICLSIFLWCSKIWRTPICKDLHFLPQTGSPPDLQYIVIQQEKPPPEVGHPVGQIRERLSTCRNGQTQPR